MMKNAIEVNHLVKKYDDKFKLGDLTLKIPSGQIIGLIGENGAGKTTLIKLILSIITKDSGDIKIFGKDYKIHEKEIKQDVGVVLDDMFFPEILTAKDISLVMKDVYKNWDDSIYHDYLKSFDIPLDKQIKKLSKGMRKKLEIITALSHNPRLLTLF